MGVVRDSTVAYSYKFVSSILRTDSLEENENIRNVIWENVDSVDIDTVSGGEKNFRLVDRYKQHYDFHLSERSRAIGTATTEAEYAMPIDRDGRRRDDRPDIGCYEFVESAKE